MAGPFELAIAEFAERAKGNADKVVRYVVMEVNARLVERSPVDTGFFRANWQYEQDRPPEGTVAVMGTSEAPAAAPAPPVLGAGTGLGHVHYIGNNAVYAWALERGHSKQAPLGIAGLTAMEFLPIVNGAVAGLDSISVAGVDQ